MLPKTVREKLNPVVDLDDPNLWAQCLYKWIKLFKQTIRIAMEYLIIAQHSDILQYARICNGVYQP